MSNLACNLGSEGPFSLQMDVSHARSWVTLKPINAVEPVDDPSMRPETSERCWLIHGTHFVSGRQTLGRPFRRIG